MSEETKTERVKVLLVFVRECETTDKKPGAIFYYVTPGEVAGEAKVDFKKREDRVYAKKNLRLGQPGTVYEFEAPPHTESSIFSATQRYFGKWHDREQVLGWELENRTFCNHRDAMKLEKKESSISLLKELLAPLREKYQSLPYPHRPAFLAAVIQQITG